MRLGATGDAQRSAAPPTTVDTQPRPATRKLEVPTRTAPAVKAGAVPPNGRPPALAQAQEAALSRPA